MRPRPPCSLVALAALASLVLVAATVVAEGPEDAEWGSLTLEGAPVDAGFLADGALVYATADAGPATGSQAACSVDADTADLYLISFPAGPGCQDALDTSGTAEGVRALATARQADLALVALPVDGSQRLSGPNLVAYEREGANLTEAWTASVNGLVLDLALDPEGQRAAVAFQTPNGNHRLATFTAAGDKQTDTQLQGYPRQLAISANARYVAAGGNVSQQDAEHGWVDLHDFSRSTDENPIVQRTIPRPRAGIVTDIALTDEGRVFAGLLDGTVRWVREAGNDRELSLATDEVRLDVDAQGTTLFATSGNESARLGVQEGKLVTEWRSRVNGTGQSAHVRTPHLFAVTETLNAFGPGGERLWETPAGTLAAVNHTGLGAVFATSTGEGGPGDTETSVVEGRVLHRNLSLEQAEPITVSPGGVSRENVTLQNTGAAIVNVTPTADAESLAIEAVPASLQLLPGSTKEISFTVEAENTAAPGNRSIPIDLQARPGVDAQPELQVQVTARPNVTVELAGGEVGERDVTQGQRLNIRLDLENRGNAEATVNLGILQSVEDPWPVTVAPNQTLTVPAGSLTTARVEVQVPAGAPNGTQNRLIVEGESQQGASAVLVKLTVNPFQTVRIRPDTITQEMAPGETTPYDLSVENLGSVGADVRLRLQPIDENGDPCLPTVWGLSLGSSRVDVPAKGSQPVRVEITAPDEIPVPEVENGTAGCTDDAQRPSLRVELRGRTDEGSRDHSILFANVDPALAEDPEPNEEPFPGLTALLLVLGAAAALRRGAKP